MMDYKSQIEAVLFSSGRFMDIDTLMQLMGLSDKRIIKQGIEKLRKEYEDRNSPLMIVEEKNGWKLTVREKYLPLVRKIVADTELPKTILETLAVIAWRAPVLQSKVVDIRHNKAYEHITELEELGFLIKEKLGRSYLLKLTQKFFNYFEVDGKQDLRKLFDQFDKGEEKEVDTKQGQINDNKDKQLSESVSPAAGLEEEKKTETVQAGKTEKENLDIDEKKIEEEIEKEFNINIDKDTKHESKEDKKGMQLTKPQENEEYTPEPGEDDSQNT
ncbi:SMC-Scp complex subunit ScpB [Candidatus Woesearchaeota archaeon]|nr:SMC-Scp complex subunit ScpB [Candidatus Woesearchaeota archaeon]